MKARRSNGDGAIDKVKRTRKDGTIVECWRGRVSVGDDPRTGKPRRVAVYASTRSELATKIAKVKTDALLGIIPSTDRITVRGFMERWLVDVAAARVRATTLELYHGMVRTHILPAIGSKRLAALTGQDVQGVLSVMQRAGKSERTRTLVLVLLRAALDQAMQWNLVPRNVARTVDRPRQVRKEIQPLTVEQAQVFLRIASSRRFAALYELAILVGLRRGELLGLQWNDVDFDAGTLSIVRSIVTLHGKPIVAETKTAAGRRRVHLPRRTVRALKEQQARLFSLGLRASPWVFPNENGEPMNPRNLIRRSFEPILAEAMNVEKEAGRSFPRIRFHDLRHTSATISMNLLIPPKVVQERLGHASIGVTMDTYSHVSASIQREAAERIDAAFAADG